MYEVEVITEDKLMQSMRQFLDKNNDSDKDYSFYTYNGIPVPRVTRVLEKTINKPWLLYWAANLGKKNMYIEKKKATTIGTYVHEMIEHFLNTGEDLEPDFLNLYYQDVEAITIAYNNFKSWYTGLYNNGFSIKVLASELKIVCPYYGGTADLIAEIGGNTYILDWKTSKQISTEYYLQTSAYMWAINNGYCSEIKHVDGIGIVRLNKDNPGFEESFLLYNNPVHASYIDDYIRAFGSLLQSYYNLIHIDQLDHKYPALEVL